MANISEAYGAVTVTAPTADILATFICAKIRREQTAAYPTTVEPWFDVFIPVYRTFNKDVWFDIAKTYVKNNAVITEQGVSVVNQFFIADGRWRVYNNLKWFFSDVVTGGTPVIKEWVDVLQASTLTATFNYTDITEDCIVVAKATVTRKDGITEIHDEEVYHEYERTEENLARIGYYSDDTYWYHERNGFGTLQRTYTKDDVGSVLLQVSEILFNRLARKHSMSRKYRRLSHIQTKADFEAFLETVSPELRDTFTQLYLCPSHIDGEAWLNGYELHIDESDDTNTYALDIIIENGEMIVFLAVEEDNNDALTHTISLVPHP